MSINMRFSYVNMGGVVFFFFFSLNDIQTWKEDVN